MTIQKMLRSEVSPDVLGLVVRQLQLTLPVAYRCPVAR